MKRILCMVLISTMFIGSLASCLKTKEEQSSTTDGSTEFNSSGGPKPYMDDFGEYDFRVLTRGSGAWKSNDILGEVMGSTVDQAVFARNEVVSKQYNFTISEKKAADWVTDAKNTFDAGIDTFDMWSFKMNDIPELAQTGYLYDLREVEYINLDAEYYDQVLRKQGTFSNYEFFLVGDLLYQDDLATQCVVFNHSIWKDSLLGKDYGVESLYELVEKGEWTLSVFQEIAKKTTIDDGDGVWDDKDQYGMSHQNADLLALNIACGNNLVTKNEDDIFELNRSEKQVTNLQSIMDLLNSGCSMYTNGSDAHFKKGLQMFNLNWIQVLPTYASTEVDYGIVPPPKADTNQTDYHSFITTYGSNCITICKSVKDANKSASIIELLSYESRRSVTPKLRNFLFAGRLVPHPEDADMLQKVLNSRSYEYCYLWTVGGVYGTMIGVNQAQGQGIASAIESLESAVNESVARKLERIENLS